MESSGHSLRSITRSALAAGRMLPFSALRDALWPGGVLAVAALLVPAVALLAGWLAALLWLGGWLLIAGLVWPPWRRALFTGPLFGLFRRLLPTVSATEQAALDAGTVGWEAELFRGRPDWQRLHAIPAPRLSAEEQAFLDGPVEALCRMLDDWRINEEWRDLSPPVWDYLRQQGFFGMVIPKSYGGLEFSAYAHSQVVMKVSSRSAAAGVTVMVPNSLGPAELLLRYGTEHQREHYLPRLARGEEIPCFALTSPEAGSDAAAMIDSGVVCRQPFQGQEDVLGIRLNWNKRFITLAPVATLLGLAFKLHDPDRLLGQTEEPGITLALIPTDTPGVWIGHRHYPLTINFLNGPTRGSDVFIPLEWVIGGRDGIGRGWGMLMECLAAGRAISLPASSTGAAKLACRAAGAYARVRRQFGQPIGRFEGVEEVLARMAGYTYAMDAARSVTAAVVDTGARPSVISAIVKYNLTEYGRRVVNDAMDVTGGRAICMGPRNWLGRAYQALPVGITVEGANILTRSLIIFGQGAVRAHPFLLREIEAVRDSDPVRGLEAFDRTLVAHLGLLVANSGRLLRGGVGNVALTSLPATGITGYYYRQLTRMSTAFAVTADAMLLLQGGQLRRREKLSGRLADILGQLYLASCALKHFADQGAPPEDRPLLEWVCQDALYTVQERLLALMQNVPQGAVAVLLQRLVFPLGRPYRPPADALGRRVAALLLTPSSARDRLTRGLYLPETSDEPLAQLEEALKKSVAAEAPERRLRQARQAGQVSGSGAEQLAQAQARGILSEQEVSLILASDAARSNVIQVDDFPFDAQGWRRDHGFDGGEAESAGLCDRREPHPVSQG